MPRARELLEQALAAQPPRLDWAALAVAALERPAVDVAAVEQALDALAEKVRAQRTGADLTSGLAALRAVLGEQGGYVGEEVDSKRAESSFLDVVLETKRGLPIALSVVYLEVARREGLPLYGISFPGQFLVGADEPGGKHVLDPFNRGRELSFADCAELLKRFAPSATLTPGLLAPAGLPVIAARMLANLKQLYLHRGQGEKALHVVDLLLVLAPDHPGELRTRAALLSALGAYRAALADVERCLKLAPAAKDAPSLALAAKNLRERVEFLN